MFEKEFNLRYFEMNKWGEASPVTMAMLLQEAASDHCNEIDCGLFDLYAQNIGWVLLSGYMQIDRYPVFKEKIIIRTWVSAHTSTRSFRENIIFDADYNIIGRSRGLWVFFDTVRKRPVKIFPHIAERWTVHSEVCSHYNIEEKLPCASTVKCRKSFDIYNYDLDANNHVNNLRYLAWALETIPDEFYNEKQLASLDARFLKEAYQGQAIESISAAEFDNGCLHHRLQIRDSGVLCAAANTAWRQRVAVPQVKVYQFA